METKRHEQYRMSASGLDEFEENERREGERREQKSKGYAYITTVGWICRRERCRRNGDHILM